MTVDEKRGIAFIPLGTARYDFYGANRKGQDLFGNSLLALDARTGNGSGISRQFITTSGTTTCPMLPSS
jgi:glucose dehydrogenase